MYGYDGQTFETFEQFLEYLSEKYGSMYDANIKSVYEWGQDLQGNVLYKDGVAQIGSEGENLINSGFNGSQSVLDAFDEDPVKFSADTFEQLQELKRAREFTANGTTYTNNSIPLGTSGGESGGSVLTATKPTVSDNGTVFNNTGIMTAERDPDDPLKWLGGLRTLGGLTLPAWTAAAAPILGVGLGVGLYEANPEFWEKLSRELLPYCYDDNGTPKMPISVDKDGNVHTSKHALEKLREIFIEEGVYSTGGTEPAGPMSENATVTRVSTGTVTTIVSDRYNETRGSIYSPKYWVSDTEYITEVRKTVSATAQSYPVIGFFYSPVASTTGNSQYFVVFDDSLGEYNSTLFAYTNTGRFVTTETGSRLYRIEYHGTTKTVYGIAFESGKNQYIENKITDLHRLLSNVVNANYLIYSYAFGNALIPVEGVTPEPGAVYPTDTTQSLEDLYPTWYANGIDVISNPVADTFEEGVERWLPLALSKTNNSNDTNDTASTETQTDAQSGTNTDDSQINQLADAILSLTEALTDAGILPSNPTIPTDPSGETPTPTPPVITGAGSDLIAIYNPTKAQIQAFNQFLWSLDPTSLTNWKKVFVNPIEAVIALQMIYVTPITGETRNIKCGYIETDVPSKIVTNQYVDVDCGSVDVSEYFHNVWDYIGTHIEIYLPFIGIVPLNVSDIMNSTLRLRYRVDVYTGTCLAQITVYKGNSFGTLYTYSGNCSVQLPITSGQFAGVWGALIAASATAVTAGFGGASVGAALGAGANVAGNSLIHSGGIQMQRSSGLGANAGAMGIRTPYLIINRKVPLDAHLYQTQYGFPANKTVTLGSVSGYTRVKDIHLSGIPCTDDELEQIESLLKEGVIIN